MKFAIIYLTEYSETVIGSVLITTFFLGGWRGPFLPGILWFVIKAFASFFFILWIRSILPRLRIDQSMKFAWKSLLPLSLINLLIVAFKTVFLPEMPPWASIPGFVLLTVLIVLLWSRFMRSGRQIVGT
jgi:NADH:ubiquinone oxidoreductase subunit H